MITKVNMICIAALCLLFTANNSVEAQVPGYVPTDGLVGYWGFNGNANDESGNGNDGIVNGASLSEGYDGAFNSAYDFDGQDDNIFLSQTTSLEGGTISLWFKTTVDELGYLFDCRPNSTTEGMACYLGGVSLLVYGMSSQGSYVDLVELEDVDIALGEWHHLACSHVEGFNQLYLDGQLIHEGNGGEYEYFSYSNLQLGSRYDQSDWLQGGIDNVGVWNRVLTAEEVMELYQSPTLGCTGETACNYNADATEDDGSCIFPPVIDLGEDIETCEESVTLDAGPGFDSYLWSTGETTQIIEVSESGDYNAEVGNASLENDFSMSFDGDDDYIDCSIATTSLDNQGAISVAFKIQSDVLHPILDGFANPSYALFNFDNGIQDPLVVRIGSGCYANSATITLEDDDCGESNPSVRAYWGNDSYLLYDDQWHEITLVSNEGGHTLYLDGDEVNLTYSLGDNSVNIWPSDATQFEIGTDLNGDFNFQGLLDEVTLWSTTISQPDIQQYIQCPPTGGEEGLVGYWNFSEGSGTTAIDLSGNGNDGVINGAVFSEDVPETNCPNCTSSDTISVTFLSSGCTDPTACNYNEEAGCDDGLCVFPVDCDTCSGEQDGTGTVVDNDADDDGVCDEDEIVGCQDPDACNYDPLATDEGVCSYVELFNISGNFGPVLFTTEAYSYPGLAGSTYEWTCTAGAIQTGNGTNEIEVIWGETGVGQVCVTETYAEGCTGDEVCAAVTVLPTNVQEIAIEQITVYPNPASTSITISTDAALLNSLYRVTDVQGKLVMEGALRNTTTLLNTDQLSNDQYTLTIIADEVVITKPLIIQK